MANGGFWAWLRRRRTRSAPEPAAAEPAATEPDPLVPPVSPDENGELHGRLRTAPVSGGKRLQACVLYLDDGTRLIAGYRPIPRFFPFERKRVSVRGTLSNPALENPMQQAVSGWHITITEIRLQDGEVPHDPPPETLPPPMRVDRLAALADCPDRDVRIVGTLLEGTALDSRTASVTLGLLDGTLVLSRLRIHQPAATPLRSLLQDGAHPALAWGDTVTVIADRAGSTPIGLTLWVGDRPTPDP